MSESFITRGGRWVVAQSVLMMAVIVTGVVFRTDKPNTAAMATGFVFLVIGAVLGIAGVKALGRNRTPFPKPREGAALVQSGAYALVRHPLYSACFH
jgi:protein-S-isoprenylcysteine O-methyltransferase Ste14